MQLSTSLPSESPSEPYGTMNGTGSLETRSSSPLPTPNSSPRLSPRGHRRAHSSFASSLESSTDQELTLSKEKSLGTTGDLTQDNASRNSSNSSELSTQKSLDVKDRERKESRTSDKVSSSDKCDNKGKKKSAWYNVLYPTYKSRCEEFRKIFKDLPTDERLIVDYSCALQREILVQGRLYTSQIHLCFHANIFGWETVVTVKWKDVTAITKEKTALVIPNAIQINTENDKYFFTSFGSRDKTYLMLFRVWQHALMDEPLSTQEMWQWVHSSYGEELGLTSEDDDYISPGLEDGQPLDLVEVLESPPISIIPIEQNGLTNGSPIHISVEDLHLTGPRPVPLSSSIPTDLSDTTESEGEKKSSPALLLPSEIAIKCPAITSHEGKQMVDIVLPVHVDQLFTLLFTNSKFLHDLHTARKTFDIIHSPWHQSEEGQKKRQMSLTVTLNNAMGPKHAQVTETQILLPCSRPGFLYAVDVEAVNSGIPYADTFYVFSHYCLFRISESESRLLVYTQLKYKKNVWGLVRSFIEKNSWAGLAEYFSSFARALKHECDSQTRTRQHKTRRRRRNLLSAAIVDEETVLPEAPLFVSPMHQRNSIHLQSRPRHWCDRLGKAVLPILVFLLLVNALLYYKLWNLENWTQSSGHLSLASYPLEDLPTTHSDWLNLLRKQEVLHKSEVERWQKVLRKAVSLLREAEDVLGELRQSVNPPDIPEDNNELPDQDNSLDDSNSSLPNTPPAKEL